jgi:hypothetical protein
MNSSMIAVSELFGGCDGGQQRQTRGLDELQEHGAPCFRRRLSGANGGAQGAQNVGELPVLGPDQRFDACPQALREQGTVAPR